MAEQSPAVLSDVVQQLLKESIGKNVEVWVGGASYAGELIDYGAWGLRMKRQGRELIVLAMHLQAVLSGKAKPKTWVQGARA